MNSLGAFSNTTLYIKNNNYLKTEHVCFDILLGRRLSCASMKNILFIC